MSSSWSELPKDLLWVIFKRLTSISDAARFGAVCSSWKLVEVENRSFCPRPLPWLMLPALNKLTNTRCFFDFYNKKVLELYLPEMYRKHCCGSSGSWLVLMDLETEELSLLNPLSRAQFQLPPLIMFPNVKPKKARNYLHIRKVVLSSRPTLNPDDDYIVMTLAGYGRRLNFCRRGDERWTGIVCPCNSIDDVIYYQDKFYVVSNEGDVVVCDMAYNPPKVAKVALPVTPTCIMQKYLVEGLSGELLLVLKHMDLVDNEDLSDYCHYTSHFEVFKLEMNSRKWIEVKSLGEQTLFLGENSSMSLSAPEFPECRKNCIYFTDDYLEGWLGECGCFDMGIFSLEDGKIEPYYPNPPFCHTPTFWVTLNP
ncbi:hypothetical protein HHK36_003708 [Tetracentron sinense]|uniref:KIB1-4 beta-propeller domain-containing protein n=1 Tax=Tetracentron sinense TaxID=13715 RepID=A0A834ZSZ3_TETSI|nr:hypothetical protein HHK36_003708 [Tetracentron sinense]